MKKTGFVYAGFLAALTLSLGSTQPAMALDFEDVLRTVLNTVSTGTLPYSSSSVKTSIDDRQLRLREQINAGVATGQLTTDEAADLRNQLLNVSSRESTYLSDNVLSFDETRSLLDDLTDLSRRLDAYMTNASTTGGIAANDHALWFQRFAARPLADGTLPNATLRKAHIDAQQAEVGARIEQGVLDGRLSWDEAARLRKELTDNESDEARYLADGRLSYDEESNLRRDLLALDQKTTRDLNDRSRGYRSDRRRYHKRSSVNGRQTVLRNRIDSGLSSGRLTTQEAANLYKKEEQIRDMESRLRTSGNGLNWREEKNLLNRLDNLSRQISRELYDRQVR